MKAVERASHSGGTEHGAVVLLTEPRQTGSDTQTMGQELRTEKIVPEAENIWFKRVRGTEVAGQQWPRSVQGEGAPHKLHLEFCLGARWWFGPAQSVWVAELSSSVQPWLLLHLSTNVA